MPRQNDRIIVQDRAGNDLDLTYGDSRWSRCECGCDRPQYNDSRFLPGHDSKLKARLVRLARAGDAQAREALERLGWEHFLLPRAERRRRVHGRKFGVELEISGLRQHDAARAIRDAGVNVRSEGYNHTTRSYWKVVTDATVPGGCEVVSPPLQGERGFDELEQVMRALRDAGASVSVRCGTHVHIDANDLGREALARVFRFFVDRQDAFDQIVSPSRRNGQYCRTWTMQEAEQVEADLRMGRRPHYNRYRTINVMSYPKYGTLEIRQHQGTLNFTKLSNWIKTLIKMFDMAKESADIMAVGTDLPGMLSGLEMPQDVISYFVDRAQGFGFLRSFDQEDLDMLASEQGVAA